MAGMLNLDYVRADEIEASLGSLRGHVLGVVAFGSGRAPVGLQPAPLQLDIPVLGGYDQCYEVWSSSARVTSCGSGRITAATDGQMLFGSMQLPQNGTDRLEALSNQAYNELFGFIRNQGYAHLWRIWNYFPQINDAEQGLERYRCFNVGRHEAFVASGRGITLENVPAASALGSDAGPLTVYFLAGRHAGKPYENPRQTSAYHYPEQYGPRSPTFARAMMVETGGRQSFFISGTASVVKSETVHLGNVQAQTEETLRNIRVLLDQAGVRGGRMLLKAYLREAAYLPTVKTQLEQEFGAGCQTVFLRSNICRSDLLLEIEGVNFGGAVQP